MERKMIQMDPNEPKCTQMENQMDTNGNKWKLNNIIEDFIQHL